MTAHLSQNLDDKEWVFLSTMETWQKDCSFLCSLSINVGNFRELEGPWNPRYLPLGWSTGFQIDERHSALTRARAVPPGKGSTVGLSKHSSGEIQAHGWSSPVQTSTDEQLGPEEVREFVWNDFSLTPGTTILVPGIFVNHIGLCSLPC